MPYTPTPYVNGAAPALSGANTRKTEDGLAAVTATAENAQATASAATAAATAANATAATAQAAATSAATAATAATAAAASKRTQAEVRDDAAAMLENGTHTNITATRVGDVVNLVGSAGGGGGGVVASTDLSDSATLARLSGAQLFTGVKTFSVAPVVPTDALPQSAVAGLTVALGLKATTAQLAGDVKAVFNLDGSNPPRPNTSATGQVVMWVYVTGNPPALNGTAAGGTYASLVTDLHLTVAA